MPDVTITVSEEAARYFGDPNEWMNIPECQEVARAFKAALPPEPTYKVGQLARVTTEEGYSFVGDWDGEAWARTRYNSGVVLTFRPEQIKEVELLQVAGEDELVVPSPVVSPGTLRAAAHLLDERFLRNTADFLRAVAERM